MDTSFWGAPFNNPEWTVIPSEGASKVWGAREPGSVVLKFECKSESSESLAKHTQTAGPHALPPPPVSKSVVAGLGREAT